MSSREAENENGEGDGGTRHWQPQGRVGSRPAVIEKREVIGNDAS